MGTKWSFLTGLFLFSLWFSFVLIIFKIFLRKQLAHKPAKFTPFSVDGENWGWSFYFIAYTGTILIRKFENLFSTLVIKNNKNNSRKVERFWILCLSKFKFIRIWDTLQINTKVENQNNCHVIFWWIRSWWTWSIAFEGITFFYDFASPKKMKSTGHLSICLILKLWIAMFLINKKKKMAIVVYVH